MGKIFYGDVIEELLMRWFSMSFLLLILWKIFARRQPKEKMPTDIFVAANLIVAIFFALGHLPSILVVFGEISGLIICRCLV